MTSFGVCVIKVVKKGVCVQIQAGTSKVFMHQLHGSGIKPYLQVYFRNMSSRKEIFAFRCSVKQNESS